MGEYEILNMLNDPFILKTFGFFMSDKKNPPAILLEYCPLDISKAIKNDSLSKVQRSLIDKCWSFDPKDRPSFKEICDEMERNKFNLVNLTKSESKEIMIQVNEFKSFIPNY